MRDTAINLRARPEQRDLFDRAAKLLGKSRSDFMLEAACDKAQSVLLHQVFFGLDGELIGNLIQAEWIERSLARSRRVVVCQKREVEGHGPPPLRHSHNSSCLNSCLKVSNSCAIAW